MICLSVRCPKCEAVLGVPEDYRGNRFICGSCRSKFKIASLSDEEILDLIGPRNLDETTAGMYPAMDEGELGADGEHHDHHDLAMKLATHMDTGITDLDMVRIDANGVLFEFSADIYKTPEFRSAFPKKCLRCGVEHHLRPHIVIFSKQMKDSASVENEYITSKPVITENDLLTKSSLDLLKIMPDVPRVPEPSELPMVFWICDLCSPDNMVFAQNKLTAQGGKMRMQIRRLWRAEEFLKNFGAQDSPAHKRLVSDIEENKETPWDCLPGVVQQRMRQWFKPGRGEIFSAYTPDRTHSRTEDGMSGIVVTNRRLIFNSSMRHREADKSTQLELDFFRASEKGQYKINIKSPNWEVKNLIIDKAGLECLRRALTKEKFNTVWR